MDPVIVVGGARVFAGDCREALKHLPDNSVDSVVTDPPYELGFMGKKWDSSGIAYDPAVWAECLRVLKPGGHLLAFGGSRTFHRLGVAIEDAGFEIRDTIAWISSKTFPKSLNVSKAIDKMNGEGGRVLKFVRWMQKTGLKAREIDDALKKAKLISPTSNRAVHYFNEGQPNIPTADFWRVVRPLCGDVPAWVDELVARVEAEREVIGQRNVPKGHAFAGPLYGGDSSLREVNETASATPEAKQWEGWGTGLKQVVEPVVMARKPLDGTVAENTLAWGVGGLNIDASRIATSDSFGGGAKATSGFVNGYENDGWVAGSEKGRWPANVILDEVTAELLDEQSGVSVSKPTESGGYLGNSLAVGGSRVKAYGSTHNDSGGASRFFYVAKASKRDRAEGLDFDNSHPTVKPTALMRYLIKLVTPQGGVVLDPFTGSGSTGKAALLDGFQFVGVELTEEYLPIIEGRLRWASEQVDEDDTLF
jgi:site-specific DNA-methyltransferase (adenine-specific)